MDNEKPKNFQKNNPLHGVKLTDMLEELETHYGWEEMGKRTNIRIFDNSPTFKMILKFLRTTPWAREKVENLYLDLKEHY